MQALPTAPVFSRSDLRATGWSDAAIGRALQSNRLIRLRRDQYAPLPPSRGAALDPAAFRSTVTRPAAVAFDPATLNRAAGDPVAIDPFAAARNTARQRARLAAFAAARSCIGSVISHRSAALLQGIPLYGVGSFRPDLTVQPGQTGDVAGALLHRATLQDDDIVAVDGHLVTHPARTALDLAHHLPTTAAVAALDFVLHEQLAQWDDLVSTAGRCRRWPGMSAARRALALVDARSESVLESISRLVVVRLGFPPPQPQVWIVDDAGVVLGRADFYWDDLGVFGKADGRIKYAQYGRTLDAEKERHESFEAAGLCGARWGWAHATSRTAVLHSRLICAIERADLLRRAGVPRRWTAHPS